MKQIRLLIYLFCICLSAFNNAYAVNVQDGELIDPMIPITLHSQQASKYNNRMKKNLNLLLSIIGSSIEGELYAVINGKILMVGDNIDQYLISEIKRHKVILLNKINKRNYVLDFSFIE